MIGPGESMAPRHVKQIKHVRISSVNMAPKGKENSQVKGSGQDELWKVCYLHTEGATCSNMAGNLSGYERSMRLHG